MKNPAKQKKYPFTPRIAYFAETASTLRRNLPEVLNQSFWQRKLTMKDKILFLERVASSSADLWAEVYKEYPELKGKDLETNCISQEITITS